MGGNFVCGRSNQAQRRPPPAFFTRDSPFFVRNG